MGFALQNRIDNHFVRLEQTSRPIVVQFDVNQELLEIFHEIFWVTSHCEKSGHKLSTSKISIIMKSDVCLFCYQQAVCCRVCINSSLWLCSKLIFIVYVTKIVVKNPDSS